MKTYRQHNCTTHHRNAKTFLRCAIWKRPEWISGTGSFAVISQCRGITISLHINSASAIESLDLINAGGCGGRCTRKHEIIRVDINGQRPRAWT